MPKDDIVKPSAPALKPASRWHDPLRLIQLGAPADSGRLLLWLVLALCALLLLWAVVGKLDIVVSAEGRLAPQTLVKIVQPAEAGVVREWLVKEGESVKAGQVLARLDTTLAQADADGSAAELMLATLSARRAEAELRGRPMQREPGDDAQRFAQIQAQYDARSRAQADSLAQEQALLEKATREWRSAQDTVARLEQILPAYRRAAQAYAKLEKDGYFSGLAAADKQRELDDKEGELQSQRNAAAAAEAAANAQQRKLGLQRSAYASDLQRELAELRARIAQLAPAADKNRYRAALMTLAAPQDGVIKDLASTTAGAVVQPGATLMTLVPVKEALFADVLVGNQDIAFIAPGQAVRIKLAAYPFQHFGLLDGEVVQVGADAQEQRAPSAAVANAGAEAAPANGAYRVRIALRSQTLRAADGRALPLAAGMQVSAEIHQGERTVLAYLLSPVQKAVQEAAREP